jgi:Ca2+-binding RTX toxin-like protein
MIFGGNGDDTINAGAGNDLCAAATVAARSTRGLGDDTLDGGNGNDTFMVATATTASFGGNGNDTMTGGTGADFLRRRRGTDTVTDFNPGQGDTKTGVEIGAVFGPTNWSESGVFSLPRSAATLVDQPMGNFASMS